jgi:hypothetical protein
MQLTICQFIFLGFFVVWSLPSRVFAQVIPDNTLPSNSTVQVNGKVEQITGGTTLGRNLYS